MLSVRENFLETLKIDGKPDRLVNGYEFMELIAPDPVLIASQHGLSIGQQGLDGFGVTWEWSENQPAAAPLPDPSKYVIPDITKWQETYKAPNLENLDWSDTIARAKAAAGKDKFVTGFFPSGLFERMHFLMGFENALCNIMIEQEATKALFDEIQKYRMRYVELIVENIEPEMFFVHDDWGMKRSLFTPPEVWREMIKPYYAEFYAYMRSKNIIVIHHADSFLEPIVGDMAEIGIDVWQGVLPENDIPKLQKELGGKMVLMGGLDVSIVDTPTATEDVIRKETRRACEAYGPGGHFIPSFTYGGPNDMIFKENLKYITDEVDKYNKEVYGI